MDKTIKLIIFSKNRPMQLYALLESFFKLCGDHSIADINILYKADEEFRAAYLSVKESFQNLNLNFIEEKDFKSDVSALIPDYGYVSFLVDDIIFKAPFRFSEILKYMDYHDECFTFSLRLGKGINYCYPTSSIQQEPSFLEDDGVLSFHHAKCEGDWGYPFSLDGNVFAAREFLVFFNARPFSSPNSLEAGLAMNKIFVNGRTSACFEEAKLFNNPDNRVQSEFNNRSESANTVLELLDKWNSGLKIDVEKLFGIRNNSCHFPVKLEYVKR